MNTRPQPPADTDATAASTPAALPPAAPRRRLRLATLVILGVCATLALGTALQLLLVEHFATDYAAREAELRLQQLSWQMRDSLNRAVSKAAGDAQLVAALAQVREARDPGAARAVLDSLQDTFPDYAWIGIADLDGKVFAAAHGLLENADVSARPWFQMGRKAVHAGDYHPAVMLGKLLPETADPWRFIDVSMPVRRADGQQWGVLGMHLSWNWARRLARTILTPALREYGAEIMVVRNDAVVLLGPPGMEEQKLQVPSVQLAQAGATGALREVWPDGKAYLTGYSQTGQPGDPSTLQWSVLVRQPAAVALAASSELERRILWSSLALGLALVLLAALLVRRLTWPMDRLSALIAERGAALAAGRAAPAIPLLDSFREAQSLSQALGAMIAADTQRALQLRDANAALESGLAAQRAELAELVARDALTGLANRRALMRELPAALIRARRVRQWCALLCLNLDGFRFINDTHGQAAGDALLCQVGARLLATARRTDTAARLDGDEFVVLLENLDGAAGAEELARKLLAALTEPYRLQAASASVDTIGAGVNISISISVSIGVALHGPDQPEQLEHWLARAGQAMREAKRGGHHAITLAAG